MVQTIYDIIEEHGGEIIVNTKASEGTEFNFFLPGYRSYSLINIEIVNII